jgi:hypothetical protein
VSGLVIALKTVSRGTLMWMVFRRFFIVSGV